MLYYSDLLMILSAIPAFMLISDGYRVKNVTKGLHQFFLFIALSIAAVLLLLLFELQFVFTIPALLIFVLIAFAKKKKS